MPTNYEKHFGDPLRAAETILGAFRHGAANCVFEMFYEIFGYRPCTGAPSTRTGIVATMRWRRSSDGLRARRPNERVRATREVRIMCMECERQMENA